MSSLKSNEILTRGPGYHGAGNGLWLQVTKAGGRSWLFRYRMNGRQREMGLGPATGPRAITLTRAQSLAREKALMRDSGIDPIDARRAEKLAAEAERAKLVTFKEAAERHVATKSSEWSNDVHAAQWTSTLRTYAYPLLGNLPVGEVTTSLVLKVLEPIWATKTETASRVRGRIEAVLDSAKVRGERDGENPARWRGHLSLILPKPRLVRTVQHHAALPYGRMGEFMARLRDQAGMSARALEVVILTALRTKEGIGARWEEFDLDDGVWTIPPARMKGKREHLVPLSPRVLEILLTLHAERLDDSPWVFPGLRPKSHLSNMAMLSLLDRMGHKDLTVHGFRSAFKDWASESTSCPNEVSEMALAHTIKNKAEAAYRRGTMFEKRRRLMNDWAEFCGRPATGSAQVIPIRT